MPRIAEFASAIIGFQSREMKYGVCVTSARANSDRQNSPGGIQAPCSTNMHLHTPLLTTTATASWLAVIAAAARLCTDHCGNCNEGHRLFHGFASAY
jgi:hypothetical protein